jgi:hypothetical protein
MPKIDQQISIVIEPKDMRQAVLSHPDWPQDQIDRSYGLVRDYGRAQEALDTFKTGKAPHLEALASALKLDPQTRCVLKPGRAYDEKSRRPYEEHVRQLRQRAQDSAWIVVGNGNLLSNVGIVGWHDGMTLRVAWEERRMQIGWAYSCFWVATSGRTGIGRFSFQDGLPRPLEDQPAGPGELAWVTSGQPILWDGKVARPKKVIAETYDVRHVYHLPTTVGDDSQKQRALRQVCRFTTLWVNQLLKPMAQATRVLNKFASREHLGTEDRYFMGALGADEEGRVYLVQRHGSISDVARALRDRGATRAILLDQGGGVGTYYQSDRHCPAGAFIFRSRDLRPERLCAIAFEVPDTWNEA